jgi:hypothetical protein
MNEIREHSLGDLAAILELIGDEALERRMAAAAHRGR